MSTDNDPTNRLNMIGFCIVAGLICIGLIGLILLTIFRPDASAVFIQQTSTLIGLALTAAGVFYVGNKTNSRLAAVETNTNGRLHAKDEELSRKDQMLLDAGINPQTGQPLTGPTSTL